MAPKYENGNVSAKCPDCGLYTSFERSSGGSVYGTIVENKIHYFRDRNYQRTLYLLLRCANCGRGAVAKIHDNGAVTDGTLDSFLPTSISRASLPAELPSDIVSEFKEAEDCASIGAYRAASGLLRSVLEKLLRHNGYKKGSLASRIDEAAADGVITESRKNRVHQEIRVLGNDVLHDDWRTVDNEEYELAHKYAQRVAEDLYDDRDSVIEILKSKNRIEG